MPSAKRAALSMWVVYSSPSDFPGQFVARRWEAQGGAPLATEDVLLADDLQALRDKLPAGVESLSRHPGDDPAIVEVWL
ncbi:hypothetical protein [Stutzerimonas stutzeri]|uniref:hypothetical protein n=1 Tax=Stutzerimonas stutzeri TaxID=316 RepID=UPI001E7BCDED|nr:hypothetical protein [Stutzerimonas stutzeri]CAB5556603.1 Uncharacterised protein [Stutzerimonas stutzeri]CAB5597994.1 Uncharacterised protein [Stutzerimonas stutzeri]CAC9159136.1 Uncharacterised protein [Stutzerimonas stutzeri]CAD0188349.1 Hypothetical_protein [Stutzerimonas stutzeri]